MTVSDVAGVIHQATGTPGEYVEIYNAGPDVVYVGGAGVTSSSGIGVAVGSEWYPPRHLDNGEHVHAVTASGESASVAVVVFRREG